MLLIAVVLCMCLFIFFFEFVLFVVFDSPVLHCNNQVGDRELVILLFVCL